MPNSKKYNYISVKKLDENEYYTPPITLSLPRWSQYVANGYNTLYDDAIIPGGTMDNGAVYTGHVRQNPFTANYY
jgi:hypothetical protein